ncbi:MAG: hypothetical protein ACKO4T_13750, partial [Planctomycetaceae bacterium]
RTLGTSAGSPPTSDSGVSSIHGGGSSAAESEPAADGSFVSGISATSAGEGDSGSSTSAIEALREAKSKPSGLPQAAKKPAADSSRDAAAAALKKFFERK